MRSKLFTMMLSSAQQCHRLEGDTRLIPNMSSLQRSQNTSSTNVHRFVCTMNLSMLNRSELRNDHNKIQHGFIYSQYRKMFIQTQSTPNPQSFMFMPGKAVMESGTFEASSARAAMASPLAKKLFLIDGVCGVFLGADFITVTKKEDAQWSVLKPDIFSAIMDHIASGEPAISNPEAASQTDTMIDENDDEVVAMIKELLETRIRPSVQEDGGDIHYRGFDTTTGIVSVRMVGACRGCSSSAITLKSGIENMLMHYIPEVKGVEQVEEIDFEDYDPLHPESNPLAQHLSP